MAKKGLDEDRLKFFKGMGIASTSESDKPESDVDKSVISESDKSESEVSELGKSKSDISEPDIIRSVTSESDKLESELPKQDKSESDVTKSTISELDKTESELSESDNKKSTYRRRRQTSKVSLPRSRAHSTMPKIRARKVDDSVLDQAILAASSSPKVSIYSPFVAAVMKCNELTTIGYKSSADSRELLEKALEQAYPDVCEKVRRYIENR